MKTLVAYHNDPSLKEALLAEVGKHREADMLVSGTYGKRDQGIFQGCAVGCSLHSLNKIQGKQYATNDHSAYEESVGVPVALAYLQDGLFERLRPKDQQEWPERFWSAIQPGADLRYIHGKWFAWTLLDDKIGLWKVWKTEKDQEAFKAFGEFVAYLAENKPFKKTEWDSVRTRFISSLARLARLARLDRLDRLDSLDSLARLASLARLDSLDRLASLARLDSLDSLASLARLARLASLARLDRLASLDLYKIAADKLIELLEQAK